MVIGGRSGEAGDDLNHQIHLPAPKLTMKRTECQVMKMLDSPRFKRYLEALIQKMIQERDNQAPPLHVPLQRPFLCDAERSTNRSVRLCFDCEIPNRVFTCNKIEAEGVEGPLPLKVVLQDTKTGAIVTQGPLSSMRLEIVLLNGDFKAEELTNWTEEEFNDNILLAREGRRPLLLGELYVTLNNGVAFFQGLSISDNSSWIPCRKFRLGVRVVQDDVGVLEAVSGAFVVRERRGESYQKHKIPALEDEVWRLNKIAKGGKYCQSLAANGIHTVKDFLQRYYTDPSSLRSILCVSNNKWDTIVEHAKSCSLNTDLYSFYSEEGAVGIVFNCVLDIVGITYDCLNYASLEMLTVIQKSHVEQIRHHVYMNQSLLIPFEQQTDPFTDSSLANLHPFNVNDKTEEDMNFNFDYPVSALAVETYPCLGEQSNHLIDVTQLQHSSLLVPFKQQTDPFTDSTLANLHPDANDQTEEDMNFSFGYPVSASAVESYPCLGEQSNHLIDVTQLQQYSIDNPMRISNVLLSPNDPITLENDVFNGSYEVPSTSNSLTRNGLYAPLPNLG